MNTTMMTTNDNQAAFNYINGTALKRDKRGRVRFGFKAHRLEVGKTGLVTCYNRMSSFRSDGEYATWHMPQSLTGNPEFLRTLANAIDLATA